MILDNYNSLSKEPTSEVKLSNLPMYIAQYLAYTHDLIDPLSSYLNDLSPNDFFEFTGYETKFTIINTTEDFIIAPDSTIYTKEPVHSNLKQEIYYSLQLEILDTQIARIMNKKLTNKALFEIVKLDRELVSTTLILPNLSNYTLNELRALEREGIDTEELLSLYLRKPVVYIKEFNKFYKIEDYIVCAIEEVDDIILLPLESYEKINKLQELNFKYVKELMMLLLNGDNIDKYLPSGHIRKTLYRLDYR